MIPIINKSDQTAKLWLLLPSFTSVVDVVPKSLEDVIVTNISDVNVAAVDSFW